jgi:maleylacetoacetate isomerase
MSAASDFALYGYFRSSAAFRVRIALNLKGLQADLRFVHLLKEGGQQHSDAYKAVNPQELIPTLAHDGHTIGQSLAIIEYLDEVAPEPALLPPGPAARARVRQIALAIACDIHPLNNLRVLQYLRHRLGADDAARTDWQHHWMATGFSALEAMLAQSAGTGRFCHGDTPTLADVCLIPQMANARRIEMDLSPYPTLLRIEEAAYRLPAFTAARPENQPDAE